MHKSTAPCNSSDAPMYSAYGCGSPPALVEEAVKASSSATDDLPDDWPTPSFVLFTGDSARHNELSKGGVLEDIKTVNDLFAQYYPDTPVVRLPTLDLGNNDFPGDYQINVTSHEPCLPTFESDGDSGAIVSTERASFGAQNQTLVLPVPTNEWLQTVAEQQSYKFVDELEKATFACGGYLNVKHHSPSYNVMFPHSQLLPHYTICIHSASAG